MGDNIKFLLVDTRVLPDVFLKVVEAKRMLARGEVRNSSEAAKMAGISRSAFYKYKDCVFAQSVETSTSVITLSIQLTDEPGQLSKVINEFHFLGANITSINQSLPVDGVALVSVSARIANGEDAGFALLRKIKELPGVVSAKIL